jgi:ATP-dependent DNA ligase
MKSSPKMALVEPPPRESRFGSPLKLSRLHWARAEVVVEVTYLTWTEGSLLRQVSYQGHREDKASNAGRAARSASGSAPLGSSSSAAST